MVDLCAAADRCLYYDRQRQSPAEVTDHLPICEGCLSAGERAVGALPFDYVSLEQLQIPSLGVWGDGQPSAGDEHPIPLNLIAEALQAEIHRVVTTWEDAVRDVDKLSDSVTKHVRQGWAIQAAVQILQPRVRLLAGIGPQPIRDYPPLEDDEPRRYQMIEYQELPGWRGVLDFSRLHRRAQRVLGLTSAKHERVERVPCARCDLVSLYRVPGDDRVWCGNDECRAIFTVDEFRRWAGLLAQFSRGREVA